MRNRVIDDGSWTDDIYDMDRPRSRVRARARPSTPSYTQASLWVILLMCSALWLPIDVPIVIIFQLTFFPCHPILRLTLTPLPCYDDLFLPGYTPFPNPNTHLCPSFSVLPPIPSIPLDPPPPYDSLFDTAAPPDTAVVPQVSLIIGMTLIHGIQMLGQAGTCSSQPTSNPPYPIFKIIFYCTCSNPSWKKSCTMELWIMALPSKVGGCGTCEYMFHFLILVKIYSYGCLS